MLNPSLLVADVTLAHDPAAVALGETTLDRAARGPSTVPNTAGTSNECGCPSVNPVTAGPVAPAATTVPAGALAAVEVTEGVTTLDRVDAGPLLVP